MDQPAYIPAGSLESSPETTDKSNNPLVNLRPLRKEPFIMALPKEGENKPTVTIDLTPKAGEMAPFVEKLRFPGSNVAKVTIKKFVPATEGKPEQYETIVNSQQLDNEKTVKFPTPVRMEKIQIVLEGTDNADDKEYKVKVAVHACFKVKVTTTTQPPTTESTTTTTTTTPKPTTTTTTTAAPTTTTEMTTPSTTTVVVTTPASTTAAPTTTESTTQSTTTTASTTTAAPTTTTTTTMAPTTTTTLSSTTTMSVKPTEGTTTTPAVIETTTTTQGTTTKVCPFQETMDTPSVIGKDQIKTHPADEDSSDKVRLGNEGWTPKVPSSQSTDEKPYVDIHLDVSDDRDEPYVEKVIVKGNVARVSVYKKNVNDDDWTEIVKDVEVKENGEVIFPTVVKADSIRIVLEKPEDSEDGKEVTNYRVNVGVHACIKPTSKF